MSTTSKYSVRQVLRVDIQPATSEWPRQDMNGGLVLDLMDWLVEVGFVSLRGVVIGPGVFHADLLVPEPFTLSQATLLIQTWLAERGCEPEDG